MHRRVILQRAGAIAAVVAARSLAVSPSLTAPDSQKNSLAKASDSVSSPMAEVVSDPTKATEDATAEVTTIAEKSTTTDTEKHSAKHGKKAHKTHGE